MAGGDELLCTGGVQGVGAAVRGRSSLEELRRETRSRTGGGGLGSKQQWRTSQAEEMLEPGSRGTAGALRRNLLAFEFEVRQWGCDKRYDIRGEGACLKRYTDSSFNTDAVGQGLPLEDLLLLGHRQSLVVCTILQANKKIFSSYHMQNFQLRTYSFSLHLKIAYYYFPGVVLNFLNITHILDALVTTNNVITEQEVQEYRHICRKMMSSVQTEKILWESSLNCCPRQQGIWICH
uniref:Uncharacterized protein n=1 Tax=Oryza rufipogon TaxID=4529 RepID=A0A0E0N7I4_ORYRU